MQQHKPMRVCLGCGSDPRLGYQQGQYGEVKTGCTESFTLYCPHCGFKCGPFQNLQAAITDWHRSNRPNDAFYADRWMERFERQIQRQAATASAVGAN